MSSHTGSAQPKIVTTIAVITTIRSNGASARSSARACRGSSARASREQDLPATAQPRKIGRHRCEPIGEDRDRPNLGRASRAAGWRRGTERVMAPDIAPPGRIAPIPEPGPAAEQQPVNLPWIAQLSSNPSRRAAEPRSQPHDPVDLPMRRRPLRIARKERAPTRRSLLAAPLARNQPRQPKATAGLRPRNRPMIDHAQRDEG